MGVASRSFEMSISRADFLRLLPRALGGAHFRENGNSFLYAEGERTWLLTLHPLQALDLGALRLERYKVEWVFSGFTEAEIHASVARFELHFRRGGG
jgi:hypothetical protein